MNSVTETGLQGKFLGFALCAWYKKKRGRYRGVREPVSILILARCLWERLCALLLLSK